MGNRWSTTFSKQQERARKAIFGTLENLDIQEAVTPFGYPEAVIRNGELLYTQVQDIRQRTTTRRGVRMATTKAVSEAENTARRAYTQLATVLRAVFVQDAAARATLGLAGSAPNSRAAFIVAAEKLFGGCLNAPADLAATLARYGYSKEKLQAEQAKLFALRDEDSAKGTSIGDSEQETAAFHAAVADLNTWVTQYRKIARIALADQPHQLEKLGM